MAVNPDFLVVCDHGGTGPAARVALLPWFADRPGWWPTQELDRQTALVYPLEDDDLGHDPKWLRPEWTQPGEVDTRRWNIELLCPESGCTTWNYRAQDDALQTMFALIGTDAAFRTAVALSADDSLIVIRLQGLHIARQRARVSLGLRV
jgi:hypothetical protein